MKLNKEELLTAMRGVLKQYEDNEHQNRFDTCPLCALYHDYEDGCTICPMTVFGKYIGCTDRKCRAISSNRDRIHIIAYERVKEFYRLSIEAFEKMTEKEINENGREILIEIDKSVYNFYK